LYRNIYNDQTAFIMIKTAQVFLSYSPIVDVYGNNLYIIL